MYKKILLSASAVLISTSAVAEDRNLVFTGINFTKDSNYFYAGAVNSPLSSITNDGLLLRASVARGSYEYNRPSSTTVDADLTSGDAMVGYQLFDLSIFNRITAYIGAEHQDHDLNTVDLSNRVQGGETGVKGMLETVVSLHDNFELDIAGSYSGAYDTYWGKAQLAYSCNCGGVKFGPEFIGLGSESFDQKRYGAFVNNIPLGEHVKGNVALGFAESARRGEDGLYAQIGFSFLF